MLTARAANREQACSILPGATARRPSKAELERTFALEVVEAYAAEARAAWRPSESARARFLRRGPALFAPVAGLAASASEKRPAWRRLLSASLQHICLSRDVAEPLQGDRRPTRRVAETPRRSGAICTHCASVRRVSFRGAVPYIGRANSRERTSRWSTKRASDVEPEAAGTPRLTRTNPARTGSQSESEVSATRRRRADRRLAAGLSNQAQHAVSLVEGGSAHFSRPFWPARSAVSWFRA